MFSDEEIKGAYRLAYFLHPDNVVAYNVTLDALDRFSLLQKQQERRIGADKPFKLLLPQNLILQTSVYLASDDWERDQERSAPLKPYSYIINRDDLLIRYIKLLVWETMGRRSCNAAIGIGCLLHSYNTAQIHNLAPDVFNEHNLRRHKSRLVARIEDRFKRWAIVSGDNKNLRTQLPTKFEQELVQKSLHTLAPWLPYGAVHQAYGGNVLEIYFSYLSSRTEWERTHVLIDPFCGGLQRVIREYNSSLPKESDDMRLEDPDEKLETPDFDGSSDGSGPDDRFTPPPLSTNELISLKRSLQQNQRRRDAHHGNKLRARVDGQEYPLKATDNNVFGPLNIHPSAPYVEVFGEDEDGDLLLAVFFLQECDWSSEHKKKELLVTNREGQQISCFVSPVISSEGDVIQLAVEISYVGKDGEVTGEQQLSSSQVGGQENRDAEIAKRHPLTRQSKNSRPLINGAVFSRLLWHLAGASSWILERDDLAVERTKFSSLGAGVLCTALLAGLSAVYTIFIIFQSLVAALVGGVLWGIAVASMERLLLISIREGRGGKPYKGFAIMLPHLCLAVLLSLTIVTPLQLRLFQGEIAERLSINHLRKFRAVNEEANGVFPEITFFENRINVLKDEIRSKEAERSGFYRDFINEADRTAGSRKVGTADVYSAKLDQLRKSEFELNSLREKNERAVEEDRVRLADLYRQRKSLVDATVRESDASGFLARLTALRQLSEENTTAWMMGWLLFLLMCLITAVPAILQFLSRRGLYDRFMELMAKEFERKYEQGIEGVSTRELTEKLEEVTNLVKFKSRVA